MSAETIMIQELVPGSGESQLSYAALAEHGRPLASLTARRVRQIPMDFLRMWFTEMPSHLTRDRIDGGM